MADSKPQITATIKFRGVTIENMSVEELKALRNVINELVGEPERVIERHYHDLVYRAIPWTTQPIWTVSGNTTTANTLHLDSGNTSGSFTLGNTANTQHCTISLN